MLTTARPIFEHVPGSFADPVGLADQQAPGVVALIVVRYDAAIRAPESGEAFPPSPIPSEPPESAQSSGASESPIPLARPTYDAFVAVSGQLLAVARTTPDYRFPVMPAVALSHFIEVRDAGRPAFLSLFELDEDDCARFLETVFYSECLKLHVAGTESAALVAAQIACSGCGNGVLEINDFSDPAAPRVRLLDLDEVADSLRGRGAGHGRDGHRAAGGPPRRIPRRGDGPRPPLRPPEKPGDAARPRRHPVRPRPRHRAGEPARHGPPWRRRPRPSEGARVASLTAAAELRATAPDTQAEAVETYLTERAERPRLVATDHPHAAGLAALVQELQGGPTVRPSAPLPEPTPPEAVPQAGRPRRAR